MGAWGYGIFDDDTAYDVMDELKRCADVTAYLERAFDTAADADYLEYDEGISALVCGAVLDSVVNGTGYRFDGFNDGDNEKVSGEEQYLAWIGSLQGVNGAGLKAKAAAALRRVTQEGSELKELWSQNEALYPKWKTGIERIAERLDGGNDIVGDG
jgi:hypothetical protein